MYGRCKVADNDTPSCFDEESSEARISGGRVADTDSPSWFRRGVVDDYVSGEGGKTLSFGATLPARLEAERLYQQPLCTLVVARHGAPFFRWSTPRLVLRRAGAGVAYRYLPIEPDAVDPQAPRWRGRWRVQVFMRVGRPSHAAQRCPPVSSTVAQWRRSGGQRLVSSCDGPIPALPARSPRTRRPLAVLRRHVSYTCRGPPATGRPSEPRFLRGTVASAGVDGDDGRGRGAGGCRKRRCAAVAGCAHDQRHPRRRGEEKPPAAPAVLWRAQAQGKVVGRGHMSRGAYLAPPVAWPTVPPSRPTSSVTPVEDVWWQTALGSAPPRPYGGTSSKSARVDPPPAPWRRAGANGVGAFWLDWSRGAALVAAQSVRSTWFIWFWGFVSYLGQRNLRVFFLLQIFQLSIWGRGVCVFFF